MSNFLVYRLNKWKNLKTKSEKIDKQPDASVISEDMESIRSVVIIGVICCLMISSLHQNIFIPDCRAHTWRTQPFLHRIPSVQLQMFPFIYRGLVPVKGFFLSPPPHYFGFRHVRNAALVFRPARRLFVSRRTHLWLCAPSAASTAWRMNISSVKTAKWLWHISPRRLSSFPPH